MEFFNKKEEVIELVMTKKGRELLSKGMFSPYYYSFNDTDITYDNNTSEEQNSIIERIKETPIVKSTTGFKQSTDATIDLYENNSETSVLKCELGSKTYGDQYAPAWDLRFLKSPNFQYVGTDIDHVIDKKRYQVSFISDIDSDKSNVELIPQIEIASIYQVVEIVKNMSIEYSLLKDEDLLVQVSENNTWDSDEFQEYELEFYYVKNSGKQYEVLDNETLKKYININFDKLADLLSGEKVADIYGPQVGADESTC